MSRKIKDGNYQVWITEYALDGNSESSKYDPGFQLVGTFKTIEEAVECHRKHDVQAPVITKLVTWETKIKDITDLPKFNQTAAVGGGVSLPPHSYLGRNQ